MLEGFPMPQVVQATLMPFGDNIITNGLISPLCVFGQKYVRRVKTDLFGCKKEWQAAL